MILGAEIGMLLFGLYVLARGKYQLTKTRIAQGSRARLAGFILLLPLPIAFGIGFALGASGNMPSGSDATLNLALMEGLVVIGCLIVSLVIAYTAPSEAS